MKIDLKTALTIGTLLFVIAGSYYTTKNDIYVLSLEVKGLKTENHDIRSRLDMMNKRLLRMNKEIKKLN